MSETKPTAKQLRELLHYNPRTGIFKWRQSGRGRRLDLVAGNPGSNERHKRVRIFVMGKLYKAHRLAWLYMTGTWPTKQIDHRDGDSLNNKFNNLREATNSINQQNQRHAQRTSKTGLLGATPHKHYFTAHIRIDGRSTNLGYFPTAELAHAAYIVAKRKHHKGCTI